MRRGGGERGAAWLVGAGAAIAVVAVAGACSGKKETTTVRGDAGFRGQVMLAITTDLVWGKDLDRIDVVIAHRKRVQSTMRYEAGRAALPITVAVTALEGDTDPIDVTVTGWQGDRPRIERRASTTIPENRNALLWTPLRWLCDGSASGGARTCGAGLTCDGGLCRSADVPSAGLPDYAPELFASPKCFDVATCFRDARDQVIEPTACTIPSGGGKAENVGIALGTDGVCGDDGRCIVALDEGAGGWSRITGTDGRPTLKLPPGVCEEIVAGRATVRRADSCETKPLQQAPCAGPVVDADAGVRAPELLATLEGTSNLGRQELVLDDASAYWIADTTLWRVPKAGGQAFPVSPASVRSAAANKSHLFQNLDSGELQRVPAAGGAPTTLATGIFADNLCVTSSWVFAVGNGRGADGGVDVGITYVPVGGGQVSFEPRLGLQPPFEYESMFGVACEGDEGSWYAAANAIVQTTRLRTFNAAQRARRDLGSIDAAPSNGPDARLSLDATDVFVLTPDYRVTDDKRTTVVTRFSRTQVGGTPFLTLAASGEPAEVFGLTVDRDRLYAGLRRMSAVQGGAPLPGGSFIVGVPKTAPSVRLDVVKGLDDVAAMAADETHVYYTTVNRGAGQNRIWRIRKP